MAGVAFAVEGDGVGFATESYAASAFYTTLASLSGALWRIRRAKTSPRISKLTSDLVENLACRSASGVCVRASLCKMYLFPAYDRPLASGQWSQSGNSRRSIK